VCGWTAGVRAAYAGTNAQVQVIDLPGGNERYADFQFGGDPDPTQITTRLRNADGLATRIEVNITNISVREVSACWLHVLGHDGLWSRYAIPVRRSVEGVSGDHAFPEPDPASTRYYVSVTRTTGEEYFTELQPPRSTAAAARRER